MLLALRKGPPARLIDASKRAWAICPICGQAVQAKCGSINIWHWAHISVIDCDPWAEGESRWHADWKLAFPRECREVVIGPHRADIALEHAVIELQSSSISPEEIRERESFYRNLHWIVKADGWLNFDLRPRDGFQSFRWKSPRKCWWSSRRPILLDLDGTMLFWVKKLYPNLPCGGWGRLVSRNDVIDYFLHGKTPQWNVI